MFTKREPIARNADPIINTRTFDVDDASSYALLATSWRHQTREFFDNSTLHGVRYIAEKGRPFCERFMWFCFTSIGAVATCIIIVSLWEKFQTNPTITGLDTDFHNWDVLFPAITVCDRSPNDPSLVEAFINSTWPDVTSDEERAKLIAFLDFLSTLSYTSIKEDASRYSSIPELETVGENLRDTVFSVVYHCEELLTNCMFKADSEDCCDMFMPVFTEVGFCYAFNTRHVEPTWPWLSKTLDPFLEQYIHETDAKWSFVFDTEHKNTLINVYIHSNDEMPGIDSNPQHVWDRRVEKISFSVKQTYTTPDARQLSIKQRRCIFDDEVKLVTDTIYTYSACMRECRMKLSKKYCGCVPHFYPKIDNFRYCTLKELRCVAEHADKIVDIDMCGRCELGCSNTVYEVEKLTEQDATKADVGDSGDTPLEAEFVSWPMVRYKREVLFGWVDLLVAFGGIAGLFLGFSLLSGVEIIYYFTLRACCMFHRDKDELGRLRRDYSQKEIPPFDLSLKPWRRAPTASLHGPRAVFQLEKPRMVAVKGKSFRRKGGTSPQQIFVKEAALDRRKNLNYENRPPTYTPPPEYGQYLP